ncbi:MAG: hypothetical protein RI980_492 [Bacteroidota bacterium]|jgi:hypothetical protein
MITFIIKGNKKYYDIQSMKEYLRISKAKIQRELKKQDAKIVKYKNLHLYNEATFFNLMELILIEKLNRLDAEY